MNDYIRRDDAVEQVKELFEMGDCYCDRYSIVGLQNALPSADVVKVTRCKDCKYINYLGSGTMGEIECSLLQILVSRYSFCSLGRKKDD